MHDAAEERGALDAYFERARAITKLMAQNQAFRDFYAAPGSRRARVTANGRPIRRVRAALGYLERLYPNSIGEACFIDRRGAENARAVHGRIAPPSQLSPDERSNPFFGPTFARRPGQVYQALPYVSPDTREWVISNSTPVPSGGRSRAIVHFEVTIDTFRRAAAVTSGRVAVRVETAASATIGARDAGPPAAAAVGLEHAGEDARGRAARPRRRRRRRSPPPRRPCGLAPAGGPQQPQRSGDDRGSSRRERPVSAAWRS